MTLPIAVFLAACGGGPAVQLPDGTPIEVEEFEAYVTDHNGYSRVRRSYATAADADVIAAFEDDDPSTPEGYRNLVEVAEDLYGDSIIVEVIAEVDGPDGPATRLLRLTVDQEPFNNVRNNELIAATGQFYLRGANYTWVSIDDGPLIEGSDENGLVNMMIDFDTETVSLNLRTGVDDGSDIRTEIDVEGLPMNIRTGEYGGDIVIQVWDPDSADIFAIDGALRGSLGGSPEYEDDTHNLTTSGLYTADGYDEATGRRVRIDGLYYGMDPNALVRR